MEIDQHQAYLQESQARFYQLEHNAIVKVKEELKVLNEKLQQQVAEKEDLRTTLNVIRDLIMHFLSGDFNFY